MPIKLPCHICGMKHEIFHMAAFSSFVMFLGKVGQHIPFENSLLGMGNTRRYVRRKIIMIVGIVCCLVFPLSAKNKKIRSFFTFCHCSNSPHPNKNPRLPSEKYFLVFDHSIDMSLSWVSDTTSGKTVKYCPREDRRVL